MITEEMVLDVMKDVYDPEIPVNVVDLGLVYDLKVEDDYVYVTMTMTAPGCPFGDQLKTETRERIISGTGAKEAEVTMVIDPPWNPSMMTDDARKALGMY
ncbi:MAG: iron-sulfur cluster assembly protein [Chloroflexota bacterium]